MKVACYASVTPEVALTSFALPRAGVMPGGGAALQEGEHWRRSHDCESFFVSTYLPVGLRLVFSYLSSLVCVG